MLSVYYEKTTEDVLQSTVLNTASKLGITVVDFTATEDIFYHGLKSATKTVILFWLHVIMLRFVAEMMDMSRCYVLFIEIEERKRLSNQKLAKVRSRCDVSISLHENIISFSSLVWRESQSSVFSLRSAARSRPHWTDGGALGEAGFVRGCAGVNGGCYVLAVRHTSSSARPLVHRDTQAARTAAANWLTSPNVTQHQTFQRSYPVGQLYSCVHVYRY